MTCAGGRLTVLVFHFSDCVICSLVLLRHSANLVPLCHLQADWLTPFDFAVHSYSGKEMKQTAAAVTCDELLQICQRKKAIVEPEEAQSLWCMCH